MFASQVYIYIYIHSQWYIIWECYLFEIYRFKEEIEGPQIEEMKTK